LPWDSVVYALNLNDMEKQVYYMITIVDNGDVRIELGGNLEYLAFGLGKNITKNLVIHAGIARKYADLLKKKGITKFYIGFSFDF